MIAASYDRRSLAIYDEPRILKVGGIVTDASAMIDCLAHNGKLIVFEESASGKTCPYAAKVTDFG